MESAWQVTDMMLTPGGRRYTVVLGEMEYIVLHNPGGWQFFDPQSNMRCDSNAGVREAVLRYERENYE